MKANLLLCITFFVAFCANLSAQHGTDFSRSQAWQLSRSANNLRKTDPIAALPVAREAYTLARKTKEDTVVAYSASLLAIIFKNISEQDSAKKYVVAATLAYRNIGDSAGVAKCKDQQGHLARNEGDYPKALLFYQQGLSIRKDLPDQDRLENSYHNLGNLFDRQARYEEALVWFKKGLARSRNVGNKQMVGKATYGIGVSLYHLGAIDSSLYYLNISEVQYKEIHALWALSDVYNLKGAIHSDKSEYNEALRAYNAAKQIFDQVHKVQGSVAASNNIGEILKMQMRYDTAIQVLEMAYDTAVHYGMFRSVAVISLQLTEVFEAIGNFEEALRYHQQHKAYADSAAGVERETKFEELRQKYNNAQLATDNMQKDLALSAERETKAKLWYSLWVAGMSILALFIGLFYLRFRNRTKLKFQRQLVEGKLKDAMLDGQESERVRIASELHDNVGSIISAAKHQLEAVKHEMKGEANVETGFNKTSKLLNQAVVEVRRISHNMSSETLEKEGLISAVSELVDYVSIATGPKVEFLSIGFEDQPALHPRVALVCYRVIQELVHNVTKHANASKINIQLRHRQHFIAIVVSDDGVGFDAETMSTSESSGIGLRNIANRVNYLHGSFEIRSVEGKGTVVKLNIPASLTSD